MRFKFLSRVSTRLFGTLYRLFPIRSVNGYGGLVSAYSSRGLLYQRKDPRTSNGSASVNVANFVASTIVGAPRVVGVGATSANVYVQFFLARWFFAFVFIQGSHHVVRVCFSLRRTIRYDVLCYFCRLVSSRRRRRGCVYYSVFLGR